MLLESYIPVINKTRLFKNISDDNILSILTFLSAKVTEYRKGEFILRYGDKINSMYIVLEGNAVIFKDDYWGNYNVISKVGPPQSFGVSYALSTDGISGVNVCAENKTVIMKLGMDKIFDPCSIGNGCHNILIRNLITVLSDRNIYLSGKIEHISQRKLRDKALAYLSDISKKKHSRSFDIPFSRRQLADYLNADRSALSNALCKLRDEGVIRFERNHFELL